MNIDDSSASSLSARPPAPTRTDGEREPAERPREAAPKEQVDRFRQLMQHGRQEGRSVAQERQDAARGGLDAGRHAGARLAADAGGDAPGPVQGQARQDRNEGGDQAATGANTCDGVELLAMIQAQSALREAPAVAPPPPPLASGKALAEMLERHVRQFAVDGAAATAGDGQVLLRMSDATLPGTDLLLSRTGEGWHLRADVRSRESFDAIREAAPALARRFAEHNLGTLEIDPHFQG